MLQLAMPAAILPVLCLAACEADLQYYKYGPMRFSDVIVVVWAAAAASVVLFGSGVCVCWVVSLSLSLSPAWS